jgi:hypothetical protein
VLETVRTDDTINSGWAPARPLCDAVDPPELGPDAVLPLDEPDDAPPEPDVAPEPLVVLPPAPALPAPLCPVAEVESVPTISTSSPTCFCRSEPWSMYVVPLVPALPLCVAVLVLPDAAPALEAPLPALPEELDPAAPEPVRALVSMKLLPDAPR